ncbi:MAG: ABC transporter substrate-binding protein [Sporolactobacillus sp.]|nr:ABC transporter substrate-binding protein [Sporolactobacillus sp.]
MSHTDFQDIHYTICPVGNTSYIAAHKGWLQEGLKPLNVQPVLLQSLPREHWRHHFDYQDNRLFREGGNIPPIWAKSRGTELILLALTFLEQKQYIFTRADDPIQRIEDLRGHKLGLPTHPKAIIDFHRASAEHGFELALSARGIVKEEVQFVDIVSAGDFIGGFKQRQQSPALEEVKALESGEVDAIYVKSTQVQKLIDTGKFKVIFAINAEPSVLAPINNEYPNVLTVSRELAETRPEVVVAYLKQLLRAGEWAKHHRQEVLKIFAQQTYGTLGQVAASHSLDFHRRLTPSLTDKGLQILDNQKRFLYDYGYIEHDFSIEDWTDRRFLQLARQKLKEEINAEAI